MDVVEPFEADPDEPGAHAGHQGFERACHLVLGFVPVVEPDEGLDPAASQVAREIEDPAGGLAGSGAEKEDWREDATAMHEMKPDLPNVVSIEGRARQSYGDRVRPRRTRSCAGDIVGKLRLTGRSWIQGAWM